jgi:hypothetical protein
MTPIAWLRVGLLAFVLTLAVAFGVIYKRAIEHARDLELQVSSLKVERDTAINRGLFLDQAFTEKLRTEGALRDLRAQRSRQFEDLKNEDQAVADWAAQPIPQRVRDIDRADQAP